LSREKTTAVVVADQLLCEAVYVRFPFIDLTLGILWKQISGIFLGSKPNFLFLWPIEVRAGLFAFLNDLVDGCLDYAIATLRLLLG
jgi:hypothetical protein